MDMQCNWFEGTEGHDLKPNYLDFAQYEKNKNFIEAFLLKIKTKYVCEEIT